MTNLKFKESKAVLHEKNGIEMNRAIMIGKLALVFTVVSVLAIPLANACSRVLWNNNDKAVVAGRTMDWSHSFDDMLFVYPRGQKMNGGVDGGAEWTSKHGSVGCSVIGYAKKYGFDFVEDGHTDGINEEGLSVHLLYLEETAYPEPDNRPAVSYLRWVRYVLDNFATGDSAIFEYIDGNLVFHHGKKFTVMTNDPAYPFHVENIKRYKDFCGEVVKFSK